MSLFAPSIGSDVAAALATPGRLVAGDSARWTVPARLVADDPQADGWVLVVRMLGPTTETLTATAISEGPDAGGWVVVLPAGKSAQLEGGSCQLSRGYAATVAATRSAPRSPPRA